MRGWRRRGRRGAESDGGTVDRVLLVATEGGVHRPDGAPEMSGRAVGALVAHGSETFAAVEGRGVWRRTAAGAWTEVTRLSDEVTCLGGDRAGKVLVGTTGAHLRLLDVAGGRVEPLDGFEEAPTREKWHTPWGGPPDTRSMATGG